MKKERTTSLWHKVIGYDMLAPRLNKEIRIVRKEKQTEIDKRALDTALYINYLLNTKRV